MRIIKSLFLFIPLFFLLSCEGPYHKPPKETIKIGLKELAAADAVVEEAEPKESIADQPSLDNKGVGPISHVELGEEIDQAMAEAGKATYNTFCIACHQMDKRMVGPPLGNVMNMRSPEWVMNMILDPDTMLQEDPVAIALLEEYVAPMANMGLSEDEAREVVEYLRTEAQ